MTELESYEVENEAEDSKTERKEAKHHKGLYKRGDV